MAVAREAPATRPEAAVGEGGASDRPLATYRRRVHASLERVHENVRDWEHLPWLHRRSFRSIELIECIARGRGGWRARIGLQPREQIVLELVIDEGFERYVSRTLEGPGAGTEIWTRLRARDAQTTDIEVAFHVPGVAAGSEAASSVGDAFVALYTRLWDEDEAMMRVRERELARLRAPGEPLPVRIALGRLSALHPRLPLRIDEGGRRVRVLLHEGRLVAHDARCPHWLGPLDEAQVEAGALVCPWHGYRFGLRDGRRCDAGAGSTSPPLRLRAAPRIVLEPPDAPDPQVWLVWEDEGDRRPG